MEIDAKLPPPRGEVAPSERERRWSGWGAAVGNGPPPGALLRSARNAPTSPQGGGNRANRALAIARAWIGTPYVHQASLKGVGCDCLGLLRGIWRELYGEEPEEIPPYSLDWAEATGAETLYMALERHCREVTREQIAAGDIALFRMLPRGPAKHCGIVGQRDLTSPNAGRSEHCERGEQCSGWGDVHRGPPPTRSVSRRLETLRPPRAGGGDFTLIHSRQNKRVSEEPFSAFWRGKLAFVFRLRG